MLQRLLSAEAPDVGVFVDDDRNDFFPNQPGSAVLLNSCCLLKNMSLFKIS